MVGTQPGCHRFQRSDLGVVVAAKQEVTLKRQRQEMEEERGRLEEDMKRLDAKLKRVRAAERRHHRSANTESASRSPAWARRTRDASLASSSLEAMCLPRPPYCPTPRSV